MVINVEDVTAVLANVADQLLVGLFLGSGHWKFSNMECPRRTGLIENLRKT
jgi:hypothetical protein